MNALGEDDREQMASKVTVREQVREHIEYAMSKSPYTNYNLGMYSPTMRHFQTPKLKHYKLCASLYIISHVL
jgi:hypothetical protein